MIGPQCCEGGVCGYGSPNHVCFVGIAPGADEWRRTLRPLTGPSGKLLDAVLDAVGIQRADVYATNLICYWKDAPTKEEIAVCAPRLQRELRQVNPKVVVLLGKLACEAILDIPFAKAQGAVVLRNGVYYLTTYHPAASLHRGVTPAEKELQINAAYSLVRDLQKLPNLLDNPTWPQPTYTVISDPDEAQKLLDSLPDKMVPVALDIETNYDKEYDKAHPFDNDIVCIGLGFDAEHAYVLTQEAIANLKWPTQVKWVYHNGAFDTQEIARHLGVWLPIGEDTMLQSYSCDERSIRGLHKLKSLSREFCGATFYEEDDHKLPRPNAETDTETEVAQYSQQLDKLYQYNAQDVVYTWRLHQHLKEWQYHEEVQHMYESLLLPAAEMLARSQYRGIYISPKHMLEIANTFGTEFYELEDKLHAFSQQVLGYPEFNVNSPKQIMQMMAYQGYNLTNTRKATLQDLLDREDIPFVKMLLRYRTLHRMIRNYLLDVQRQIKYDGRVHPHAFLIGTVTGRLTYKDPAVQTLPKPKTVKDLGRIRSIFAATNDDYILVEADYAQIEAWLGAYFSRDQVLLADLQSGDWHSNVATGMFGCTPQSVDKDTWAFYRDAAKHINYGSMYGEEAQGLTRRPPIGIGCDLRTAQDYLKRWREHYPGFVAYQKNCRDRAQNDGFIVTPFGRKRRFPLIVNDHQLRQAMNTEMQSTAGDYTLSSAIRLWKQLEPLDAHLLFVEHDAVYYEVAKRHLSEVMQIIKYEMEKPPLPELPSIKIEIDLGENLAEMERVV